jgi:predicted nucleotidyltransferase
MEKCASIIADEPDEYKKWLNIYLKEGNSYPAARQHALEKLGVNESVLSSPNNILGIEYIKALMQRKSNIAPATLTRIGEGYNSGDITDTEFASANGIRNALENGNTKLHALKSHMPQGAYAVLDDYYCKGNSFIYPNDFSQILIYKLLQPGNDKTAFAEFYDVGEQLSNTIYNHVMDFTNFNEFALACKSKNLTYTRVCRSLMHILLDMTQNDADILKENDYSHYARLLGFSQKGQTLLKSIKANSSIPIITKPVSALKQLDKVSVMSLSKDIYAANIYECVKQQKSLGNSKIKNELTQEIIKAV